MAPALGAMSLSQAQQHEMPPDVPTQVGRKKQRTAGVRSSDLDALHAEFAAADASSGTLMKIELINFMNHAHLVVDLKPGVNFVFGKNGSGKSALLSGCMVGLGSKAVSVKSGTKLQSYIQSGKQSCTVKIWLYNGGTDSYQPDVYGPQVIIERMIDSRTGGGRHVARAADGTVVIERTSQMGELCDHFNIQVSNPCVVLTQEKARRFLASTDDRVRYEFFMEATGLNATKRYLLQVDSDVGRMEDEIARFEASLPALEKDMQTKKAAWDAATELQKIDDEIVSLRCMAACKRAADAERVADDARASMEGHASALDAAATKQQALRDALADAAAAAEAARAKTNAFEGQVGVYDARIQALAGDKARAERERQQAKQKAEGAEARALKARQDAREIRERAARDEAGRAARQQAEARRRDARRAELRARLDASDARLAQLRADAESIDTEMGTSGARAAAARREEEELSRALHALKAQHATLASSSGVAQRAALFGRDMPRLLHAIEQNARRFSQPPAGPLGLYITVTDDRWAKAAESALQPLLNNFVVSTHQDRAVLDGLCRSLKLDAGWTPPIVVMKFDSNEKPYDLPPSKLPDRSRFKLMLDVLSFSHAMAQQVAVDRAGVERFVLCATLAEAQACTSAQHGSAGANVARAYVESGHSAFAKGATEVTAPPAPGSDKRKTGVDPSEQIARLSAEIAERSAQLEHQRARARALVEGDLGFRAREEANARAIKAARAEQARAKSELDEVNQEGGFDEQSAQLALDEAERKEAEGARLMDQAEQLKAAVRDAEQRIGPLAAKLNDVRAESETLVARAAEDNDMAHAAHQLLAKRRKALDAHVKFLAELERQRGDSQSKIDALQRTALALRAQANTTLAAGAEPPDISNCTVGKLEQMVTRREARRSEILAARASTAGAGAGAGRRRGSRASGGDGAAMLPSAAQIAQLEAAYREAEERLASQVTLKENVTVDMEALHKARRLRAKQWAADREKMGEETSAAFNHELSLRSLGGVLKFDHQIDDARSMLTIEVRTSAQDAAANTTQNVSTLSGGERSFTTMAFQIALWNFINVPFRCMDEFDVFMDDAFRRQAIKCLLAACDRQPSGQFLFLTPQDMSSMLDMDTKPRHIFRMPDPRTD